MHKIKSAYSKNRLKKEKYWANQSKYYHHQIDFPSIGAYS